MALLVEDHLIPLYFVIVSLELAWVLLAVRYFGRTGNVAHQDIHLHLNLQEASWVSEQLEDIRLDRVLLCKDRKVQKVDDHH